MPKSFYVYTHCKPCGKVFYVGKGSGNRAWSLGHRNEAWKRTVSKHGYQVCIVQDGLSEGLAFDMERRLIAKYGRSNLTNFTDGGEGVSGWKHNDATRALMSKIRQGKKHSEQTKSLMSKSHLGVPHKNKGRTLTEEHKKKVGVSISGHRNANYDATEYMFTHKSLGTRITTRWQMRKEFGLHHSALNRLVNGKALHTGGWQIERCND